MVTAGAQPCRVPDCRKSGQVVRIWIGGEPVSVAFCGPHGAEYRVDEVVPVPLLRSVA